MKQLSIEYLRSDKTIEEYELDNGETAFIYNNQGIYFSLFFSKKQLMRFITGESDYSGIMFTNEKRLNNYLEKREKRNPTMSPEQKIVILKQARDAFMKRPSKGMHNSAGLCYYLILTFSLHESEMKQILRNYYNDLEYTIIECSQRVAYHKHKHLRYNRAKWCTLRIKELELTGR